MSAAAPTESARLRDRRLRPDDLAACRALSDEAGWNQTDADWQLILSQPGTRGIVQDGRLVASAAVVPHGGRIGWICMVLVTASARRKGHATRLMRWAIGHTRRRGLIAGLDATPAGREVYLQIGFNDLYPVTRLQGIAPIRGPAPSAQLAILTETDLPDVAAFDRLRFGADRGGLLAALRARMPQAAMILRDGTGGVRGFGLSRDGARATQIGPIVADDENAAIGLATALLGACDGSVLCDVPDRHAALHEVFAGFGFERQRPFMRMARGIRLPFDRPEAIFALTGPEFG